MSNELIVNVTSGETRVAFLEGGVLSELMIERAHEVGIVGNIYQGKVQRVLPGMNAAFVEIGQEKAAFLYATDFSQELKEIGEDLDKDEDEDEGEGEAPAEGGEENLPDELRRYKWGGTKPIHMLLKPAQEILVQVARGPISTKGARITSHISLPGRYLVYMPTWGKIGVSKKVESYEERVRLRQTIRKIRPPQGGFILRTAAETASEEQLHQDVSFLWKLWQEILRRKENVVAPALIQPELDVALRALRDLYGAKIDRVVVDDPEEYEKIKGFIENLMPELLPSLELYPHLEPIFDRFGIESEITRALGRKVWLKSGGYLIVEQTEALTTIDVNTGRFTGKKNLEETILRNNLEAVEEIAYQMKIRNIGGIIILDFIDMEKRSNREKVYSALREALKNDRSKTTITKISEIGLIEMTRKRTRESLKGHLSQDCPYCEAKGYVKSPITVVYDIFRHLRREASSLPDKVLLSVNPSVFNLLLDVERKGLATVEKKIGKRVELKAQDNYHIEQFEVGRA